MTRLIRIPKCFLDDHAERDLPTPVVQRATRRHYGIRADDPALDELMSDARYYAEGGIDLSAFPHLIGLVASARATLAAIRKSKGTAP